MRKKKAQAVAQDKYNKVKDQHNLMDKISELPDGIVISIVSLLTLKEAVASSILSRRWRYVWASSMTLNFDIDSIFGSLAYLEPKLRLERLDIDGYINRVNSVVEQHRGPRIQQFRVYCNITDPRFTGPFIKWFKFAVGKRVQMLELVAGVSGKIQYSITYPQNLNPNQLLDIKQGSTDLNHVCSEPDIPRPHHCALSGFKYFKAATFLGVEMANGALERFLSHCPSLERLSVFYCTKLRGLRAAGPSVGVALKYLEIRGCPALQSIEICDANLVSFSYLGREINLILKMVPRLVEANIRYTSERDFLMHAFTQLSCCLPQLEVLRLTEPMPYDDNREFPILANLKHLELTFQPNDGCCLLRLTSFLKASPHLQKLVLKLNNYWEREIQQKADNFSHHCLRVVELQGYCHTSSDFELVMYLIENAVELKKIVIPPDPIRDMYYYDRLAKAKSKEVKTEEKARKLARHQLREKVPSTIELVCHL